MSASPAVVRRVMRELSELEKNPPEGIRVQMNDEDMMDVTGLIEGPEGTPYKGGYFRVKFKFTDEFPAAPPKCWFATKIFHPNVGPTGEICVNTLKKDWKSTYGIGHILVTVKCLLIYPNPESALDEEAGKLLLEEYQSYCDRAKLITSVHATPRVKPVEFMTPAAVEVEEGNGKEASSSKATTPIASTSSTATPAIVTSSSENSSLTAPSSGFRKSASPAPQSKKEGLTATAHLISQKDRHPSPSPLSTADANVEGVGKPGIGPGVGGRLNSGSSGGAGAKAGAGGAGTTSGSKAMKRSATGSVPTGAEKRKKALKRL